MATKKSQPAHDTQGYIDPAAPVTSLTRDLAAAAAHMTPTEARFLVDYYYICQDDRIRFDGQVRSMEASQEPNMVLGWLGDQSSLLEKQIQRALAKYTDEHEIGSWIKSIHGLGPVIAAGLIAHIDITKAPTVGHIWSYGGLVPGVKWEKGQKRPWNAKLKTLLWKAGESFVKFSNSPKCYYGHLFKERRAFEWERNLKGFHDIKVPGPDGTLSGIQRVSVREQALAASENYGKDTEAYAWTSGCYKASDIEDYLDLDTLVAGSTDDDNDVDAEANRLKSLAAAQVAKFKGKPGTGDPMFPPMQIHSRARRFAVKIFLSHLHEFWYETHFKMRVPKPFAIEHLGHVHRIEVPGYNSPYAANEPPPKRYHQGM